MGGFINNQALKRNLLCFLTFPYQKLSNLCVLEVLCSYIWEISLFSMQKSAFSYFAKGILCNFTYFPTKFVYFYVKYTSILYYVCVLSKYCIKLNFMPFLYLLSKLFILWHFHSKVSKSWLSKLSCMFNHSKCVLLSRSHHLLCVWHL